jgi:hypothetical protein
MPIRVFLGIISILFSAPVFAYIDPGTGSAIVSAIIALIVGIAVAIKGYWYKLKATALRLVKPAGQTDTEVTELSQDPSQELPPEK